MKKFIVSSLILCACCCRCSSTTRHGDIHLIDITERNCISKMNSTAEINECSNKAINAWFKEIDKYLDLLKTSTSKEDYETILISHREWKNYQESEFAAINLINQKQGTMYQNSIAGMKRDIVKIEL